MVDEYTAGNGPSFLLGLGIGIRWVIDRIRRGNKQQLGHSFLAKPIANGMRLWDHKFGYFYFYSGKHLDYTEAEIDRVCRKHNPYYNLLSDQQQGLFIQRLQAFVWSKEYYIIGFEGYREMPILVSAAATQIMFGLDEFTLPHFLKIIIHPQEYMGYEPMRVLAGNVKGRAITLSWKHFIEDFSRANDGHNVGLHELAHALQVQHIFTHNATFDKEFREDYHHYDALDDQIAKSESHNNKTLFSANALSDPDEFWACSIELFFEQPIRLKEQHPQLYQAISAVLNQDMAALQQAANKA